VERRQEGVVLLEQAGGMRGSFIQALRLRRRLLKLGGRVERRQEGVVLHQRAEGLPEVSWQRERALYAWLRSNHAQPDPRRLARADCEARGHAI